MEKEFVTYELALKMKELGYNEPCFGFHSKIHGLMMVKTSGSSSLYKDAGECLAPTYSQAFRWFREMYGLDSFCRQTNLDGRSYFKISRIETDEIIRGYSNFTSTYEEAEIACLTKIIEIEEERIKKEWDLYLKQKKDERKEN